MSKIKLKSLKYFSENNINAQFNEPFVHTKFTIGMENAYRLVFNLN